MICYTILIEPIIKANSVLERPRFLQTDSAYSENLTRAEQVYSETYSNWICGVWQSWSLENLPLWKWMLMQTYPVLWCYFHAQPQNKLPFNVGNVDTVGGSVERDGVAIHDRMLVVPGIPTKWWVYKLVLVVVFTHLARHNQSGPRWNMIYPQGKDVKNHNTFEGSTKSPAKTMKHGELQFLYLSLQAASHWPSIHLGRFCGSSSRCLSKYLDEIDEINNRFW